MHRNRRLWWPWPVGCLVLAGGMVILGYGFRRGGLNAAGSVASILAVIPIFASVIISTRNRARPNTPPSAAQLKQALEDLAADVKEQWLREAGARQLYDPDPVGVLWQTRESSVDDPVSATGARGPDLDFISTQDPAELGAWFWHLERRRLVILAEPGMGKTTLAMMLLLELLRLANPPAGETPVPVLLSLSSFNPLIEDFDWWLARRLGEDSPILQDAKDRQDALLSLVRRRQIIPILDGLDELSKGARIATVVKLNAALADGELGFILTCRTDEYEATVQEAGDVRSAYVIEAQPLDPNDVGTYLETHVPAHSLGSWEPVLASLSDLGSALSNALDTPLMLWLIYQVYVGTGRDPQGLADIERFPDPDAIRSHLFNNLIPALIESYPPDSKLPGRPERNWNTVKVRRWLEYLAWHLNGMATYNLAWWELPAAISRRDSYLSILPPLELPHRSRGPLRGISNIGRGIVIWAELLMGSMLGLISGFIIGAAAGLVTGFVTRLPVGLATGVTTGIAMALTIGPTVGFSFRLSAREVPYYPAGSFDSGFTTPGGVLRNSRREFVRRNLAFGLILGLIFGFIFSLLGGLSFGLTFGILAALVSMLSFSVTALAIGVVAGGRMLGVPAWPAYTLVRTALKLERRLPWRLMRFLADAHRLGIVRQAGAVYQFRHATLQDHLAEAYSRSSHPVRRALATQLAKDSSTSQVS
jgi:hypothetical protein